MKLRITPEDHLKGRAVDPGIYNVEVANIEEKQASTDGSQNWNVDFKIIDGKFKGVTVYKTFNEKGAGFAIDFAKACGATIDPKKDYDLDFNRTLHCKLRVDVKNKLYEGNMKNNVVGFLPLAKETPIEKAPEA